MNKIQNTWNEMRLSYQNRYIDYIKNYNRDKSNKENLGHLLECSYVLIEVFGLTSKQVTELEKCDYLGLTDDDFES